MVSNHFQQMKTQICTVGDVAMGFAHYQSSKLLASNIPLISGESGADPLCYPVYQQNLEWSAKTKIPDHLGFSPNFENLTLKDSYVTCLQNIFCYFECLRSAYKKKLDLFYKMVLKLCSIEWCIFPQISRVHQHNSQKYCQLSDVYHNTVISFVNR